MDESKEKLLAKAWNAALKHPLIWLFFVLTLVIIIAFVVGFNIKTKKGTEIDVKGVGGIKDAITNPSKPVPQAPGNLPVAP